MVLEDHSSWLTTGLSFIIALILAMVIFVVIFGVVNYTIERNIGDIYLNKTIEIKVKDIVKTENAYIIFDTDNNMYAYPKLLPEITVGKNYSIYRGYTISKFHNFYEVAKVVET